MKTHHQCAEILKLQMALGNTYLVSFPKCKSTHVYMNAITSSSAELNIYIRTLPFDSIAAERFPLLKIVAATSTNLYTFTYMYIHVHTLVLQNNMSKHIILLIYIYIHLFICKIMCKLCTFADITKVWFCLMHTCTYAHILYMYKYSHAVIPILLCTTVFNNRD